MSTAIVHILDEATINKIAAGEVVERPASVVKELIENAIDAQATAIEVEVMNGGIDYIRVTDNGLGMSREDAERSILRHATSKIKTAEELTQIHTLGFRGEALSSISAVAKFNLTTRQLQVQLAVLVAVEGGIVKEVREAGAAPGTTIIASDLFYNIPARRKFLKTPPTESAHIHDAVSKLALSHPAISFKLINNQKQVLITPGNGKLSEVAASIYGHKVFEELLPVEWSGQDIAVNGFVSTPALLKSSRQWQTVFVNCRAVNSRMISKAIDNAYQATLPKQGYPLAIVNIILAPDSIDVNVHPQKSEVKFSDEQAVYKGVYKAILVALTNEQQELAVPAASFVANSFVNSSIYKEVPKPALPKTEVEQQSLSIAAPEQKKAAPETYLRHYNYPGRETIARDKPGDSIDFVAVRTELAKEQVLSYVGKTTAADMTESKNAAREIMPLPLGQVESCYIVAQGSDGLYIIDQHAAHERIIFNKLCKNTDRIPGQHLLVPCVLDIDNAESLAVTEYEEIITELGFTAEQIGPGTVRLVEMPADLLATQAEDYFRQLLEIISNNAGQAKGADLRQSYLQTMACRAAVKAGDALNMRQIKALIEELWQTDKPYTCPHGRPVIVKFRQEELSKLFKRT